MSSVIFTFGRFQPPGKGHEKLVKAVHVLAARNKSDHVIYLSQTQKLVTDPLAWSFKLRTCKAAFPGTKFSIDSAIKTPFQALESLAKRYKDVTFVVGGDRLEEFEERMTPYAYLWDIENFQIISAGQRNPASRGITGMSGSKLRQYVQEGNSEKFYQALPDRLNSSMKKQVYLQTKKGLGINARTRDSVIARTKG